MNKTIVIEHFGSITATAKALGISHVAVSKWDETIPKGRAYQIEVLTGGQLKAEHTTASQQHSQRVDMTTASNDFPCVKRAIATSTALSNSDTQQPTPCVQPHE